MGTTIRVATFNCENLFARYKFKQNYDVGTISAEGWDINKTRFDISNDTEKKITGRAMKALKADVIALQEVENLDVLKRFRSGYLGGYKAFPHLALIEGNDPRLIDVAVLSKYPIAHVRSHQHRRSGTSYIHSRDCLEVDIDVDGFPLHLFVNHLKSMMGGRKATHKRRLGQATDVREIITERFGSDTKKTPFLVLGDLNDYPQTDAEGKTALGPLLDWNLLENVVDRLPDAERWTHYYVGGKSYSQLDYILASKPLQPHVVGVEIERRGLPLRADRFTGTRFPGVGKNSPKASDHCPLLVEIST